MAAITFTKVSETIKENRWSAEFFEPQYLFKPKDHYKWVRIGRILNQCQYGISISMNEENKGFPIFRMNEIDNCFTTEAVKYAAISEKEFKQFELEYDDVVFNRTNSIDFVGRTGIYKGGVPSTFASYLVRVKTDRNFILPEFLTIYLNTKFGKGQIRRRAMHSINQANVSAAELRRILIPLIEIEKQKRVSEMVNKAYELKAKSKDLYSQATQLLDDALGLKSIEFKMEKSYTTSFSEVVVRSRFDGEHYQPKYEQIKKQIKEYKNGWEPFLLNVNYIRPNIDPHKAPNSDFHYIELADINPALGIINKIQPIKGFQTPSRARRVITSGDIIASSVVGSVEKAALVSDSENGYIASTGFFHFRSSYYTPEFLLMMVKNRFFKEQLFQESTGGILSAVPDSNLLHIILPKFSSDIQDNVTDLVRKSHSSARESELLLEQAKQEVETLIEQAAQTA